MASVIAELSEKKVTFLNVHPRLHTPDKFPILKIEGFKLHVTHNIRPFVNRIRYAPEVASRPDRLAKDLANARTLATLLEDEAAKLRSVKSPLPPPAFANGDDAGVKSEENPDATMAAPGDEDEESEPKERGSDAVERRIEKVMADLRELGVIDVNDEKAYEEKKVCFWCSYFWFVR